MVIGARKMLVPAVGLALVGSLLTGLPATAADTDPDGPSPTAYARTWYDVAIAPATAPVGTPVQVHGYIGIQPDTIWERRQPGRGLQVKIYFDPSGTAPRELLTTVVTNDDAWFAKTFMPTTSGTYDVVVANQGTDVVGTQSVKFTRRLASQPVRSVVVSGSKNGHTARVRVTVQDVVTRIEPQTVYLDAGILTPGYSANIYAGPAMTNRRAEGRYGSGDVTTGDQDLWDTFYSGTRTYRLSALHPAGLYDVYYEGPIRVETDHWDTDGDGTLQSVAVPIPWKSVTTVRVRRASSTTISASSTSFTGAKTITLRGAVRKVQLVSNTKAAIRLSPNTPVKLYFDPAGSAGPQHLKTVWTNSEGIYNTKYRTTRSGTWIAKYPGTDLQAPSERSVAITVR
ncbi:hypothetical protein AB1046_16600 [Promicromonospora sp. Populi]|uniref:hypothetical protein n=1 Tax=Promicromonospora sp. Populi TaxID=3239420 RepID=UPI0034E2D099